MKISFSLTSRLMVIMAVCSFAIVTLLIMLGFELGLRQAHEDEEARAKVRGDAQHASNLPASVTTKGSP